MWPLIPSIITGLLVSFGISFVFRLAGEQTAKLLSNNIQAIHQFEADNVFGPPSVEYEPENIFNPPKLRFERKVFGNPFY